MVFLPTHPYGLDAGAARPQFQASGGPRNLDLIPDLRNLVRRVKKVEAVLIVGIVPRRRPMEFQGDVE